MVIDGIYIYIYIHRSYYIKINYMFRPLTMAIFRLKLKYLVSSYTRHILPFSYTRHILPFPPFGGNGSIAWTSAMSHVGRTSNAFKVTMKLQTFLFQMVVTSCISVQYLWKYGFAKSSINLHAPCIMQHLYHHTYRWPSRAQVFSQPVHWTATYRWDDTRCCITQFWPPDDEYIVLETCRGV